MHAPTTGAHSAHLNLLELKINGSTLWPSHGDGADICLEQAHALLTALATGFRATDDDNLSLSGLNEDILACATEGVRTLVALAQFNRDADQMQHRAAPQDDPVAHFWTAYDAYNSGQSLEPKFLAAVRELDRWSPPTPPDFVRKFLAVYVDRASPNAARSATIYEQAEALLGGRG
jgi:hypothetical protein